MPRHIAVLVSVVIAAALPAYAQQYPARPVTIVVPLGAGGGSDLLARLVAQKLEHRLGRSFIIENRPGGGTTLAATLVARAKPDGYTLLQATSSTMAVNVTLQKGCRTIPSTISCRWRCSRHHPSCSPCAPIRRSSRLPI